MSRSDLKTVNEVLLKVTGRGATHVMRWMDAHGAWQPITSDELYGRVRALAEVLGSWGVAKGDRVVLLSENRWEWPVVDFATLALGAVDVPLYATNTPEQVGYMLRDSGARVAFVSSAEQYKKLAACGELPLLEHVVVMDKGDFEGAASFEHLLADAARKQTRDAQFDSSLAEVQPSDLATIIYTSGTTGEPKGVMLTHGNLASNINMSLVTLDSIEGDRCVSFLPLSHVTARHVDYVLMSKGAELAYCPRFDLLPAAMKAVQPTMFVGVPRVYEKIRQAVESKSAASSAKHAILRWSLATGKTHRQATLEGRTPGALGWKLANKLVYAKVREAFGGSVRTWVSGGAPLGMDTAGWFADAGIRIFEGYGLTETSPVIAVNYASASRIGSVGKPVSNVETRFAPDGELEVRGPSVFAGYWNKPKETAEAFCEDGWFKTGDIGHVDQDGFLSITDRKKELLKTSGGKFIAPQAIENKLKANLLVGQAALVGDKHKFVCALISPNLPALEQWAKIQGLTAGSTAELIREPKVTAEYQRIVNEVNKGLAPYETMKRTQVVPEEWSVEGGELTPSMKLKRRVVERKYEREIAAFYADEASAKAS